jgi:hypothetical protein
MKSEIADHQIKEITIMASDLVHDYIRKNVPGISVDDYIKAVTFIGAILSSEILACVSIKSGLYEDYKIMLDEIVLNISDQIKQMATDKWLELNHKK